MNVGTGTVSDSYLSLDQGIVMAAIGNALGHDMLRKAFATQEFKHVTPAPDLDGEVQRRSA